MPAVTIAATSKLDNGWPESEKKVGPRAKRSIVRYVHGREIYEDGSKKEDVHV